MKRRTGDTSEPSVKVVDVTPIRERDLRRACAPAAPTPVRKFRCAAGYREHGRRGGRRQSAIVRLRRPLATESS